MASAAIATDELAMHVYLIIHVSQYLFTFMSRLFNYILLTTTIIYHLQLSYTHSIINQLQSSIIKSPLLFQLFELML